jgi:hypothetical protein
VAAQYRDIDERELGSREVGVLPSKLAGMLQNGLRITRPATPQEVGGPTNRIIGPSHWTKLTVCHRSFGHARHCATGCASRPVFNGRFDVWPEQANESSR